MVKASQFQMLKGRADSEVNILKVKLLSSPWGIRCLLSYYLLPWNSQAANITFFFDYTYTSAQSLVLSLKLACSTIRSLKWLLHIYRAHRRMERVFPNRNASKWRRNRLFAQGTKNYLAMMNYMIWENDFMKLLSFILGNQAPGTWRFNGQRKLMAFEHKKYHFP